MLVECEVLPGLAPFACDELRAAGATIIGVNDTAVTADGELDSLDSLRTVVAVYVIERFSVPRPKALLGHEHFTRLAAAITSLRERHPYHAIRISAAGRESVTFQRLERELAAAAGVAVDRRDGDLFVRVRPGDGGWEVLIRSTPRPLSARPWREVNARGALNATIAAALLTMAGGGRILDPTCGSGTLVAEADRDAEVVGVDRDPRMLRAAATNVRAAARRVRLLLGDAAALPFAAATFDAVVANPPWGTLSGSHSANTSLYPALLAEARRVLRPGGRVALVTHEIRLLDACLDSAAWSVERDVRVWAKGHRPRMVLLRAS